MDTIGLDLHKRESHLCILASDMQTSAFLPRGRSYVPATNRTRVRRSAAEWCAPRPCG